MRRVTLVLLTISVAACGGASSAGFPTSPSVAESTYDVVGRGIPQFVGQRHMALANIDRISRFRSAVGHSYTDSAEQCRSMKHYFTPKGTTIPATLLIYSPVDGTVRTYDPESSGFGFQINIQPTAQPAFRVIVFHVTPSIPVAVGTNVSAGQLLGTHYGIQTDSDVAVSVNTPQGYRLVSWFDVITDTLFQEYRASGVIARDDMIISRAARDADPLTCNGETFTTTGTLANWVALR